MDMRRVQKAISRSERERRDWQSEENKEKRWLGKEIYFYVRSIVGPCHVYLKLEKWKISFVPLLFTFSSMLELLEWEYRMGNLHF